MEYRTVYGICNVVLKVASMVGVFASIYVYFVLLQLWRDQNYVAGCDLAPTMSCTAVIKTKYSEGFGVFPKISWLSIPNCLLGIMYYSVLAVFVMFDNMKAAWIVVLLAFLGLCSSVYFAYVMFFMIGNICVVCIATYVVNFVNFVASVVKLLYMKRDRKEKQEAKKKLEKKVN